MNTEAVRVIANSLYFPGDGITWLAAEGMAEVILAEVLALLTPEDIGLECVNSNPVLGWPWYRYPEVPREQFRGHGPDRYKETYPL